MTIVSCKFHKTIDTIRDKLPVYYDSAHLLVFRIVFSLNYSFVDNFSSEQKAF